VLGKKSCGPTGVVETRDWGCSEDEGESGKDDERVNEGVRVSARELDVNGAKSGKVGGGGT
jgi:hypothetical protein